MNVENLNRIASILRDSGEIDGYSGKEGRIENEVAYDLSEIFHSVDEIHNKYMPIILESSDSKVSGEALFNIRECLRHIVYHIMDSEYFSIVCPIRNDAVSD